jgi:hypothetical protein
LVTNGTYASGSRVAFGSMMNRLAVTKAVIVQSINGPGQTSIQGHKLPLNTYGDSAVRCVYLTNGAVLAGFTLSGGATRKAGDILKERCGGGVWVEGSTAIVSNCVITGNSAFDHGGGAYGGTFINCTIIANRAEQHGGGIFNSVLSTCTMSQNTAAIGGGGVDSSTGDRCSLTGNSAIVAGGVMNSTLYNSVIISNSASSAGGAMYSSLNNCTLIGNSATESIGGGYETAFNNCIVCYNTAPSDPNYVLASQTMNYSCSIPLPPNGAGNITNEPILMDVAAGDFRLQSTSPCINAGNNGYVNKTGDHDGDPRIQGMTVDIGAYEVQFPSSVLSFAWAQQYGLPTDGSADFQDPDADGMNNWQESIAGTVPTNAASVLTMLLPVSADSSNRVIAWQSVSNRIYYLQRSTNLNSQPAFWTTFSNIVGQQGITSFTDSNTAVLPSAFYRVGIQ